MNIRQIIILVLSFLVVGAGAILNLTSFGGSNSIEIFENNPTYLTPYTVTFFVWIVVWVGMIAFALYQALPAQKGSKYLDSLLPWYFIMSLANVGWVAAWQAGFITVSPVIMGVQLVALIGAHLSLSANRPEPLEFSWQDKIFSYLFIGFYYGWTVVMLASNIAVALQVAGYNNLLVNDQLWAAILLGLMGMIGLIMLIGFQDVPFAAALSWGMFGIYANNLLDQQIQIGFFVGIGLVVVGLGVAIFQWSKIQQANKPVDYF